MFCIVMDWACENVLKCTAFVEWGIDLKSWVEVVIIERMWYHPDSDWFSALVSLDQWSNFMWFGNNSFSQLERFCRIFETDPTIADHWIEVNSKSWQFHTTYWSSIGVTMLFAQSRKISFAQFWMEETRLHCWQPEVVSQFVFRFQPCAWKVFV